MTTGGSPCWQRIARPRARPAWPQLAVVPGAGLTFSLRWHFMPAPHMPAGLSLVVGLAVARTLEDLGVEGAAKWPNDVLIHGKKLAGILVELSSSAGVRRRR